jgi:hypothetical protein
MSESTPELGREANLIRTISGLAKTAGITAAATVLYGYDTGKNIASRARVGELARHLGGVAGEWSGWPQEKANQPGGVSANIIIFADTETSLELPVETAQNSAV